MRPPSREIVCIRSLLKDIKDNSRVGLSLKVLPAQGLGFIENE